MQKNSRHYLLLAFISFLLAVVPLPAHAYTYYSPTKMPVSYGNVICPYINVNNNLDPYNGYAFGLTRRIIPCIKETLLYVVGNDGSDSLPSPPKPNTKGVLLRLADYAAGTIGLMCILAVALLGALMLTGRSSAMMRDSLVLGIKLGAVVMFTSNFVNIFGLLLDALDGLVGMVAGFVYVPIKSFVDSGACPEPPIGETYVLLLWDSIDCALEVLIGGIFSPATLLMGITGFVVSCIFSGPTGFFLAMILVYLIIHLILAIIRALYIYVSAYIGFALMAIISPFFIPLILFRATKGYFAKWLRITLSFFAQPIILVAYLGMLLAAYDTVVYFGPTSLYRAFVGSEVDDPCFFAPINQECIDDDGNIRSGEGGLGVWLLTQGAYLDSDVGSQAVQVNPSDVISKLSPPGTPVDTALNDYMAQVVTQGASDQQFGLFNFLGIGSAGKLDLRFIKVNLRVTGIDWYVLAYLNGYVDNPPIGPPFIDVKKYLVNLIICAAMALMTAYIFLTMLDFIPFLGSGIAMASGVLGEKSLGIPSLGTRQMEPPTEAIFNKLKLNWNPKAPG